MDCVFLGPSDPIFVGARVLDNKDESSSLQNLQISVSALETRYAELEEANRKLRQILSETPHKRIQYKTVQKVPPVSSKWKFCTVSD